MRSYGTLPSDDLPTAPPQLRQATHEPDKAGRVRGRKGYCFLLVLAICMCIMLVWLYPLFENQDSPAMGPPPMPLPDQFNRDPLYIWLVEHDGNAHDRQLATSKSLYAVDVFLIDTSNGTFLPCISGFEL